MNGRPWTSDEESKLRRLVASGMTDGQIGEAMNRSRFSVNRRRNSLDLQPGVPQRYRAMVARMSLRRQLARAT